MPEIGPLKINFETRSETLKKLKDGFKEEVSFKFTSPGGFSINWKASLDNHPLNELPKKVLKNLGECYLTITIPRGIKQATIDQFFEEIIEEEEYPETE